MGLEHGFIVIKLDEHFLYPMRLYITPIKLKPALDEMAMSDDWSVDNRIGLS